MSAVIFDGTKLAREREKILAEKVARLPQAPRIASVVFGEDAGSQLYTRLKAEAADRVGIEFERHDFSLNDPVDLIEEQIGKICQREDISGVLIQKPSKKTWVNSTGNDPAGFGDWWHLLTAALEVTKDVDCLTAANLNKVLAGNYKVVPATVKGIMVILEKALGGDLAGKKAVVVGKSEIVGLPLAAILRQEGVEVDLCDSHTEDLAGKIRQAEMVISATGRTNLITADMISPGAVVVDVGSPGADVDFEAVKEKAAFITPVPEGVGPMTVVSLLENLVSVL